MSDHQPLKVILNPERNISVMSASRIIRCNVLLSAYDFQIEYRKGSELFEADMLSRLPLDQSTEVECNVNSFNVSSELPLSYADIAKVSKKDPVLLKVIDFVKTGWPNKVESAFRPFFQKRHEMSVEEGCLMVGVRVVIPEVLKTEVLSLLHEDHIGIVRAKMLARSVCWWPDMQEDIYKIS